EYLIAVTDLPTATVKPRIAIGTGSALWLIALDVVTNRKPLRGSFQEALYASPPGSHQLLVLIQRQSSSGLELLEDTYERAQVLSDMTAELATSMLGRIEMISVFLSQTAVDAPLGCGQRTGVVHGFGRRIRRRARRWRG